MTDSEKLDEDVMTDATVTEEPASKKSAKAGIIVGCVLALAGAAGGFYLTRSGLLPFAQQPKDHADEGAEKATPVKALPAISYVDLPPVIVAVNTGESRHLKFHAQLEVNDPYAKDVESMLPRIMDVLNGYLRALEVSDFEDSLALVRIRGHLQRRIEIVVGDGRVRDVLITEFVLN